MNVWTLLIITLSAQPQVTYEFIMASSFWTIPCIQSNEIFSQLQLFTIVSYILIETRVNMALTRLQPTKRHEKRKGKGY